MQLWDFGGQEEYHFLLPDYIEGAAGAMYVYDITRYISRRHLDGWLQKLLESGEIIHDIPILIVGSKLDLQSRKSVALETPSKLVNEFNIVETMECSSKTGENVQEVFKTLIKKILENQKNLN